MRKSCQNGPGGIKLQSKRGLSESDFRDKGTCGKKKSLPYLLGGGGGGRIKNGMSQCDLSLCC